KGDKPAPGPKADDAAKKGTRRALLIGCSDYPKLSPKLWLKGPANDVLMMHEVLTRHFDFKPENIVTLSEAQGKKDSNLDPDPANIEREYTELAKKAQEGDYIVILMAGHGSQQPEKEGSPEPEPDGLDELFLPRDTGKWDGGKGTVENAIIDDELGE